MPAVARVRGGAQIRARLGKLHPLVRDKIGPYAGRRAMWIARNEIQSGPWAYEDVTGETRRSVRMLTHRDDETVQVAVYTGVAWATVLEFQDPEGHEWGYRTGKWFGAAWRRVHGRVSDRFVRSFENRFHHETEKLT